MLEIGLGCDMSYGPGASYHLWKTILSEHDELWEAEVDERCIEKFKRQGRIVYFSSFSSTEE